MSFVSDRLKGENAEDSVAQILSCNWDVHKASDLENGPFSDWDLSVAQRETGSEVFTVEVKYDEMEDTTGNMAIEIYNPKSDKPSGLMATKADLWCHVLKESVFITTVKKLKEFVRNTKPFRTVGAAGDGNAKIHLFKTDDILYIFHRIDGLNKEFVFNEIHSLLEEEADEQK
jgi:hypothetical protein